MERQIAGSFFNNLKEVRASMGPNPNLRVVIEKKDGRLFIPRPAKDILNKEQREDIFCELQGYLSLNGNGKKIIVFPRMELFFRTLYDIEQRFLGNNPSLAIVVKQKDGKYYPVGKPVNLKNKNAKIILGLYAKRVRKQQGFQVIILPLKLNVVV